METNVDLESMTPEEREAYWREQYENYDAIKAFIQAAGSVKGPTNAVEECRFERGKFDVTDFIF